MERFTKDQKKNVCIRIFEYLEKKCDRNEKGTHKAKTRKQKKNEKKTKNKKKKKEIMKGNRKNIKKETKKNEYH